METEGYWEGWRLGILDTEGFVEGWLLGWNDGTEQEIFTLAELVEKFDLNRVHKAGAKFDPEKNKWFNQLYLMIQKEEDLAKAFSSILVDKNIDVTKYDLVKIVSLIKV